MGLASGQTKEQRYDQNTSSIMCPVAIAITVPLFGAGWLAPLLELLRSNRALANFQRRSKLEFNAVLTIPQARTWQFRAPKNSETGREIGSSRAW